MVDRSVRVRLVANTDQYGREMGRAADKTRSLERQVGQLQHKVHNGFRGLGITAGIGAGVAGLGALVTQSVKAAATFDTTMRQIAVATGAPASRIKGLGALALKMGQDTVFSAQDAGGAMLELAKGGLTEAQIRAGALASTLTLASAGQLQLGDAAGFVVQGLKVFDLGAERSAEVAAALAGGANASTASVQDMGLALSQVGPGARLAGLTLQQTTGVLALFANNGIKGSDAGTSLKTMLARLVPQTEAQAAAMRKLGLNFVDAKGRFKSIDVVAQQLHDRLGKLSEARRTEALNTIFGSDAARAAAVLMKEGAAGVQQATRATSDKVAADRMAKATTEGMAGALSQLSGSIDTAKLQLGQALAPLVVDIANHMTGWANSLSTNVIPTLADFIKGMEDGTGPGGKFRDTLDEIGGAVGSAWQVARPMLSFIGDHPHLFTEIAKDAVIFAGAMKGVSLVRGLTGASSLGRGGGGLLGAGASLTSPVPVFVTNAGGLGGTGGVPGAGVPGKGTKGTFSSPAGQIVLMADVVLVPKAFESLRHQLPKLFDAMADKKNVDRLYGTFYAQASAQSKAILDAHRNEIKQGLAEGSKGNFDVLHDAVKRLELDLATGMSAAQRKAAQQLGDKILPEVILSLGKANSAMPGVSTTFGKLGTVAGRSFSSNMTDLISGGVSSSLAQVQRLDGFRLRGTLSVNVITQMGALSKLDRLAGGGPISGKGTGTSDDILAWLSNGEYVVDAENADRHRPLLDAITGRSGGATATRQGLPAFAAGGPVSFNPGRGSLLTQSARLRASGGSADDIRALIAAYDAYISRLAQAAERQRLLNDQARAQRAYDKAGARDKAQALADLRSTQGDLRDFDRQAAQDAQRRGAEANAAALDRQATAAQHLAEIQDNMYALGKIGAQDEAKLLTARMSKLEMYSNEWTSLYRQREQVFADEHQKALETATFMTPAAQLAGQAGAGGLGAGAAGLVLNGGIQLQGTSATPAELVRELGWLLR
jgi:TP901 family phage tail tape measure protein